DANKAPHDIDATLEQRVQVERRALRAADQLRGRHAASPDDVVYLVISLVEIARRVEPPLNVQASIDSRHPDVLADRQRHVPSRTLDFFRKLHPCRWR